MLYKLTATNKSKELIVTNKSKYKHVRKGEEMLRGRDIYFFCHLFSHALTYV